MLITDLIFQIKNFKCNKESKLKFKYIKNIEKNIASEIHKGIVDGFKEDQNLVREFGGRSILADPTKNMRSKLNIEVKHRENWRPFCPSVNDYVFKNILKQIKIVLI